MISALEVTGVNRSHLSGSSIHAIDFQNGLEKACGERPPSVLTCPGNTVVNAMSGLRSAYVYSTR